MLLRGGPWWEVIYALSRLSNEYLLSGYLVPGTVLGAENGL